MKKFIRRLEIAAKELANLLANVLVPIVSMVLFICELIPGFPAKGLSLMKKAEYFLFNASGTAVKIEEELNKKKRKI